MQEFNDINPVELLIKISTDVAAINTNMTNLQEKMNDRNELVDQRMTKHEEKTAEEINQLKEDVAKLKDNVAELKVKEDKKYASMFKRVIAFILAGLGGIFVAKLPDIIKLFMEK